MKSTTDTKRLIVTHVFEGAHDPLLPVPNPCEVEGVASAHAQILYGLLRPIIHKSSTRSCCVFVNNHRRGGRKRIGGEGVGVQVTATPSFERKCFLQPVCVRATEENRED